jgi:hypothetical protein
VNHSTLKTFAQDARRKLRQLVGNRLDYVLNTDTAELRQLAPQVAELRASLQSEGRDSLVERVAYTWFNRLAALRFMDANGYHPFGARVVTPGSPNETFPEILQQARAGTLDQDLAALPVRSSPERTVSQSTTDLLSGRIPSSHSEAEVYRLLLVAACNYYHRLMPFMFEKIGDATELLLPEDLITKHSIVFDFRENLPDEDCQDVEIIGWLYQYYISEKKAAVMAKNEPVLQDDIPAVTQVFTPHWVVRYLVENSLGPLWLLNRPQSRLCDRMPYYVAGESEADFLKIVEPEEVKLLDPACGSGHILTYAYDVFYSIYEEEGYDAPDIPGLILKNNLYGIEICDRAAALAAFALCMKARSSDARFFRRVVQPNVISLQEIDFEEGELQSYFQALGTQPSAFHPELLTILHQFVESKNLGSLIHPSISRSELVQIRDKISTFNPQIFTRDLPIAATHTKVLRALEHAEFLSQRYQIVAANPPYMGDAGYNPPLKEFVETHYKAGLTDLYGAFILRNLEFVVPHGSVAMITIPNWMFIQTFEELRHHLLANAQFRSFIFNGRGVWGSDFGSCAFSATKSSAAQLKGAFKRLFRKQGEVNSNEELQRRFFNNVDFQIFRASTAQLRMIPGAPIAFWVSDQMRRAFAEGKPLAECTEMRKGLATGENPRFLRLWFEVSLACLGLGFTSREEAAKSKMKWFPHNKGGEARKWFGNLDHVINWANDGYEIRNFRAANGRLRSRPQNLGYSFKQALTWSKITIGAFTARYCEGGCLFDDAAAIGHSPDRSRLFRILPILNSKVGVGILQSLNPTVNLQIGDISRTPIIELQPETERRRLEERTQECIRFAQSDWDNFETSWGFGDAPVLRPGLRGATLEASWLNWKSQCDSAIRQVQEFETENNRLFLAAYGLQDELKPEVPDEQITLARPEVRKDMVAFVSYGVGCMMGRYSLDKSGLILADAGGTLDQFVTKVGKPLGELTFEPDNDGIIPVLEGEWFRDDIAGQLRAFLKVTFGEQKLTENLSFIETSLGKDLHKYFAKDFYKNHLSQERAYGYKKRPIYWMFASPNGSFQALVYLHRYTRDTVDRLLNDYVRTFIDKLEQEQRQLNGIRLNEAARASDKTKAAKDLIKIEKMLKEIRDWERNVLLPLAQKRIELDLDDGVKANYLKFPAALVPISGFEQEED